MSSEPLRRDTRVFISAVSSELRSIRKIVKAALESNDYHAVEQDTSFQPDYRDLVEKLRERISSCDAVIHIAGHCYGAEPTNRPDDAERQKLQAQHRQRLTSTGREYTSPGTREELDQKIRTIQLKYAKVVDELTAVDKKVDEVRGELATTGGKLTRWVLAVLRDLTEFRALIQNRRRQ